MYEEGGARPGEAEQLDQADDSAIGIYQRDDEGLARQIRLWFKESSDALSEPRKNRKAAWKMLAGHQWEDTDKKQMEDGGRPALTLNMLQTIIAAVEGEERTNRQEIKLYGEGKEDEAAAYGLNRLVKWVMAQCGGEFSLSDMFRSGVAIGEGWVVPEVDYFDDPDGRIKLDFVNDEECFPDPLDLCPVGSRSRYFIRVRMMADDEGEARFPGKFKDLLRNKILEEGIGKESDGSGAPRNDIYLTREDLASPKLYDAKKKLWAVLEVWFVQIEPGWVVVNEQTGLLDEKTDAELEALKIQRREEQRKFIQDVVTGVYDQPMMGGGVPAAVPDPANPAAPAMPMPMMPQPQMPPPIQAKQRPIRRLYQCFACYDQILERRASPLRGLKRIPYVPFRAIFDKEKLEWRGLIKDLIDPQKQHNVEQSVIVQLMQLMPKQAFMAPKGGYHNKHEWQTKIAQPGAMLEYNSQRGKPEPIPVPPIPRHLIDMAFTRPQSMREISGVNVEMTGVRQGSDPGVVMEQRSKAAKTVLSPIFDNYRRSKIEVGKVLLSYIQTYLSPGRKIRVLGPEGVDYVHVTEEMSVLRYDIIIDEANATVTDQIATLNVMQTTLPQLAKAGISIPPEFADLLPMPPHVKMALKRQWAWEMTVAGKVPPPGWQPGMPIPMAPMALPAPGGAPPQPSPAA